GHLVGEFPHEKIDGADIESYIAPGNTTPMRRQDKAGRQCHWILEIHLTDPERRFGGFYEQLLDLGWRNRITGEIEATAGNRELFRTKRIGNPRSVYCCAWLKRLPSTAGTGP